MPNRTKGFRSAQLTLATLLLAAVLAVEAQADPVGSTCFDLGDGSVRTISDGTSNTIAFGETFCGSLGDGGARGRDGLPAILDGTPDRYGVVRPQLIVLGDGSVRDGTSNTIFVGETPALLTAGNGWTRAADGTIRDGSSNTVLIGDGSVRGPRGAFYYDPGTPALGDGSVRFGDGSVRTISDGTSNTIFLGDGSVRTLDGRRGIGVIADGSSNTILFEEIPVEVSAGDPDGVDLYLPKGHYRLRSVPGGADGGAWSFGAATTCLARSLDGSCAGWSGGFWLRSGPGPDQDARFGDGSVWPTPLDALRGAPLVDLWIDAEGPLTLYLAADPSGFTDNRGSIVLVVDVVEAVPAPAPLLVLAGALAGLWRLRRGG